MITSSVHLYHTVITGSVLYCNNWFFTHVLYCDNRLCTCIVITSSVHLYYLTAPAKPAIEKVHQKIPVRHDLKAEDFFGPLFRSPNRIFHSPKKHTKEIIMGVNEAEAAEVMEAAEMMEAKEMMEAEQLPRTGKLVVLPDPVPVTSASTTTARAVTSTTTARPTTTTARPTTTTARPTTTTARPTTTTAAPVTTTTTKKAPLKIKSFIVNSFGQAVSRPSSPSSSSSSSTVTPVRESKALEVAARPKGNYQYEGRSYILTWRNRRNNFDWAGGVSYCRSQGMKLVSLDTKEKAEHFLRLVATDRAPYFWAGGRVSSDSRSISWQNGASQGVTR